MADRRRKRSGVALNTPNLNSGVTLSLPPHEGKEVLEGLEVVLGVLEGQLYQETIWTAPAQCLSLTCRHSPPPPRWLAGSWSPG